MKVDVLSELLRAVKLRGAVYFDVTARLGTAPTAARELAPSVLLEVRDHVIEFHVVRRGSCWVDLNGAPSVLLEEGDIAVFPRDSAHLRGTGQSGAGVDLVLGFLTSEVRPSNPLFAALPRLLRLRGRTELLATLLSWAVTESRAPRAGGQVVLARLSELMFMDVVRDHVASLERTHHGWLSGLCDETVGRALTALHEDPSRAWNLDDLSHAAGASRSCLAARFAEHVGVPPMKYLAHWRMQLASSLLAGPTNIAAIAGSVGYASEASLSRAFKKVVGVAPSTWRTMNQSASDSRT